MTDRTCSVEGCDGPHAAKGKCAKHYYRGYKSKKKCSIDGCSEPLVGRGWCGKHYQRWTKWGDPLHVEQIMGDDEARFWSKVDINGPVPSHRPDLGPCWAWTGPTSHNGYGRFTIGTVEVRAARWIYGLKVEPIPDGSEPDHLCLNPGCVNYLYHLEAVTQRENILRSRNPMAINAAKTHCDSGHELSRANIYTPPGTTKRKCRECARAAHRRYKERRRAMAGTVAA
jgi:hypothetical protein